MRIKIVLAIALCLLATKGIAFSGNSSSSEDSLLVSLQDTKQVELYVTSWCPYCRQAMDFFKSRGIYFALYDIERDENAASRKKELDPRKGVPFAVINGVKIHGFSQDAYLKALNQN